MVMAILVSVRTEARLGFIIDLRGLSLQCHVFLFGPEEAAYLAEEVG